MHGIHDVLRACFDDVLRRIKDQHSMHEHDDFAVRSWLPYSLPSLWLIQASIFSSKSPEVKRAYLGTPSLSMLSQETF